ncbi:hypothetical protein LWI28_004329 [Acer negundo]|uniref:Uncharacterized protein n=1 Tax=Acer negundo TaxID=4023 RepID=A0AAD5I528_ACENE|nr:hypothetical protein LWI28_004329 [Acer negundo]KAK4834723.1 hypothetical protein QYF36_027349 [Acer negundo]
MKASLKFREEQKPLFRAKVPLSIVGLPFQSGIVAGDTKELTLNLSTFFESGPSIKISYRPNDTWNPFSLVVKTGTGPFGSPISSSMHMSAEFNLLSRGNPTFMLHFKPQFGDFSVKKSQSSVFDTISASNKHQKGAVLEDDSLIEVVEETPMLKKITVLPSRAAGDFTGLLSGVELTARTALPVRSRAVVNLRWGVRFPAEMKNGESTAGIDFKKIPYLVMNKIGIEHVDGADLKGVTSKKAEASSNGDVAEVCFNVKRQLEVLQSENGLLKRAVEDLRQEIIKGKPIGGDFNSGKYTEIDRNGINKGSKKSMEGDTNEELKKALKGATGGA